MALYFHRCCFSHSFTLSCDVMWYAEIRFVIPLLQINRFHNSPSFYHTINKQVWSYLDCNFQKPKKKKIVKLLKFIVFISTFYVYLHWQWSWADAGCTRLFQKGEATVNYFYHRIFKWPVWNCHFSWVAVQVIYYK